MNIKPKKTTYSYETSLVKRVKTSAFDISVPDWQHLTNKMKLIPCIKAINLFPNIGLILLGVGMTTLVSVFTSSENQIIFLGFSMITLIPGLVFLLAFPKKRNIQIQKVEWCKREICDEIKHIEERYEKGEQNNKD